MKCKEFHRYIKQQGWVEVRQRGSHIIYAKDGHPRNVPVPYHPSREIPESLRLAIIKEMGLE